MASLGFSVGDFITVGVLASQVYLRCKASVLEFKDLSREVKSMQIVLDVIGSFWTEEEAHGRHLGIEPKNRLKQLAGDCEDVLHNVEALLDEHRALARGSKMARMRWLAIQINPIRIRLMASTNLLATLNNTITARSHANSQAKVLEALNVIQRDLWEGKRRATAVSRATNDELDDNHSEAWQNINAEVESVGVDSASVVENQQFIRRWIDQVILDEADEEDEGRRDTESLPWPVLATHPDEKVAAMPLGSPDNDKAGTQRTAGDALAQSAQASSSVERPVRVPSFDSQRSQDSSWRPSEGPNRDHVQKLLAELFLAAELNVMENTVLLAKRIFHQLDWLNRGFLFRHIIEDEFRDAISKVKMRLSDEQLVQLVSDGDKNRDGVIDRDEFVELISHLLVLFVKGEDEGLQENIAKNSSLGIDYCTREVTKMFANNPSQAILPWGWKCSSTEPAKFIFEDGSTTFMTSDAMPPVTLRSFRVATFVAIRLCVRMIDHALTMWSQELIKNPRVSDEYRQPIDDVSMAASRFALFESGKSSSRWGSKLDKFYELASLVVSVKSTGSEPERATDLLAKLTKLRNDTFNVLRLILGFVAALGQLPGSEWQNSPPSIEDWRKLRMETRANHIREASGLVLTSKPLINECLSWLDNNPSLPSEALDGLQQAMTLKAAMDTIRVEKHMNQFKRRNKVKITVISAQNLPKQDSNQVPISKAEITVSKGTVEPSYRPCLECRRTCNPVWNYVSHWEVGPESHITIGILLRKLPPPGILAKLRRDNRHEPLGSCVRKRVGDLVGDLSVPECHEETLQLVGHPLSTVKFTVEPHPPVKLSATHSAVTDIRQLMMSINEAPLPEGWQKMTTADGRTYFRNVAEGKNTIAFDFSVPLEDELVIPTVKPQPLEDELVIPTVKPQPLEDELVTPTVKPQPLRRAGDHRPPMTNRAKEV